MADGTAISWAEATWNVITGCEVLSPGCKRCYAMRLAGGRLKNHWSRQGLTVDTKAGPVWTGEVRYNPEWLDQPLRWSRPRMIFVAAHSDIGHPGILEEWRDCIFAVAALRPDHIFLVLTKRPDVLGAYLAHPTTPGRVFAHAMRLGVKTRRTRDPNAVHATAQRISNWPLPNVWVGASAEDQPHLDERLPHLLTLPAVLHWLSIEPMLGPVDIGHAVGWRGFSNGFDPLEQRISWVIAGGESQDSDRPIDPRWVRSLRDQCQAAGIAFHFKQWGDWRPLETTDRNIAARLEPSIRSRLETNGIPVSEIDMIKVGAAAAGRMLDGRIWDEFPHTRATLEGQF